MIFFTYKELQEKKANKVDLVFNKRFKDLNKEEKKARGLLKKLKATKNSNEQRLVYSKLVRCADKLELSHKLLNEAEQILSSTNEIFK